MHKSVSAVCMEAGQ